MASVGNYQSFPTDGTPPPVPEIQQYLRKISLVVYGTDLSSNGTNGLDLSSLRIKFNVKRSDTMTPNVADIRVYNVSSETALSMLINLSPTTGSSGLLQNHGKVILQAGYDSNFGVIFQGNIKQIILGRESATDTFVDIIAGDGEHAYNFAIVNTTIAAGATPQNQLNAVVNATKPLGVGLGYVGDTQGPNLPRGKVMFGNAKNYARAIANNTNQTWSIQDEQITFVPVSSYVPGTQVFLSSKTGLIGTPQQTNVGLDVKCLLNPFIKIGGLINIDEAIVADYKINLSAPGSPANNPAPLTQDGVYYVMVAEHSGDTRGIEWYTSMICINKDVTTNPLNSVEVGYG